MSSGPRVLFVDDEPNVLSGLKRMLRNQRNVWQMDFASSADDALLRFSEQPFDVIVSDMRMPGMDGAELLSRVAKEYPQTVRLVLSGQSKQERILRAVGPAHQFLSKPCDAELLVNTVKRACGVKVRLGNSALQQIVSQIDNLPSLPSAYRRLVEELSSDAASIDCVGEIIGSDLAMSAKVLQLTNSSFFGIPHHVACPKQAVSLLGLGVIRPMALTVGAFSAFESSDDSFCLEQAIAHGLEVATVAKRIAEQQSGSEQLCDDAFIAGMLHDFGKLILATHMPEEFQLCLLRAETERRFLDEIEQEAFGTTHADVGAYLLELWGLPAPIVEAVAFHHQPQEVSQAHFSPLIAVHVANALVNERSLSVREFTRKPKLNREYLEGISTDFDIDSWRALAGNDTHASKTFV